MKILLVVLVLVWLLVAAVVYVQQARTNKAQIAVALGWPIWLVMYLRGDFRG